MSTAKSAGKSVVGACLMVVLATASASESVGTLVRVDGFAAVSQGAQYVKGYEGMRLREGERLMVMEGGSAVITYADGCQYTLKDNELLTIGPTSACTSNGVGSHKVDPYRAVSLDPDVAAGGFQFAALGEPALGDRNDDNDEDKGWIPAAAASVFTLIAILDDGSNSISP